MIISHLLLVPLGEGSFGIVYLVKRYSDGQHYALKKVSKTSILHFCWHDGLIQHRHKKFNRKMEMSNTLTCFIPLGKNACLI